MSETLQTTGSEQSSGTTSQSQTNGGAAPTPYYESFADKALAADVTIQKYASPEDLARGHVNLQKRFGVPEERRIDLPEDMANAEAMRDVWSKLGLPDKPEGYGFKIDGASESDNAMLGKYVAEAHKVGLPTAQARQMLDWWVSENAAAQKAAAEAQAQRRADGETMLKTAFGNAYDARIREAGNLLARYDPKGETGFKAEDLSLFPQLTQMLIRMSDRMAEPEGGLAGETQQAERPLTPAQAQAQLSTFNLDEAKQKALFDDRHPSHKAVLAERQKLLEAANPRPGAAR